jgi:hypothetical protein
MDARKTAKAKKMTPEEANTKIKRIGGSGNKSCFMCNAKHQLCLKCAQSRVTTSAFAKVVFDSIDKKRKEGVEFRDAVRALMTLAAPLPNISPVPDIPSQDNVVSAEALMIVCEAPIDTK